MEIIPVLLKEMAQEAETTKKMLSIVPNDKLDWQPHAKSMTIRQLAGHIAELPGWVSLALTTDELDFAVNAYQPPVINSNNDLLDLHEKTLTDALDKLKDTNEQILVETWTLRNREQVYSQTTKLEMVRISFSQIVHHRAQLGVFLRLLNVPIPGSYGPSADEQGF